VDHHDAGVIFRQEWFRLTVGSAFDQSLRVCYARLGGAAWSRGHAH
jgi:hypothetical protein